MKNSFLFGIILSLLILGIAMLHWLDRENEKENRESDYYYMNFHHLKFQEEVDTTLIGRQFSLFLFFDSHCDLCKLEAENLKDLPLKTNNVEIIWLSLQLETELEDFATKFGMGNIPNIYFAQTDTATLRYMYKIEGVPSYILYENGIMHRRGKGIFDENLLWDRIDKLEKESNENN